MTASYLALTDFMRPGGMTPDELLRELRSGRLIASAPNQTVTAANTNNGADPHAFVVNMQHAAEWMANPQTPPAMLAKFKFSIRHKPH